MRLLVLLLVLRTLAASGGESENLRLAIQDLRASFSVSYLPGEEFLNRLQALEPLLGPATTNEGAPARAEFTRLEREALAANPLVSGQPLLFVVREQYRPDHHNTATFFPSAQHEYNDGRFSPGGALKCIDFSRGGEVKTLLMRAGFIKLAMSNDGPTPLEVRNLRAAARASQVTGCAIASHTVGGRLARQEMDILAEAGLDLRRFIWVHAQTEPNLPVLIESASRGAFVELDTVGAPFQPQAELLETVIALIQAGFIDQLLLSHDAGWYNPARFDGLPDEGYRGYTALARDFIPALLKRGITEEQVRVVTVDNPARAFGFAEDCEKYNEATRLGWHLYRFTPAMVTEWASDWNCGGFAFSEDGTR